MNSESSLKPSMEMPVQWQIIVTEMRSGAPWPVATVQFLEGGACCLIGSAAQSYAALLQATKKAAITIALQSMKEALQSDLHPSPALSPETASPPATSSGDGASQAHNLNGEADPISTSTALS